MSRSCSATGLSKASSAEPAPSRAFASTRCKRSRPGSRCCCGSCPTARAERDGARGEVARERSHNRSEPLPVGRRDRGVPRAGAARGRGCIVVGDDADRRRRPRLGAELGLDVVAVDGGDARAGRRRPRAGRGAATDATSCEALALGARGRRAVRRPRGQPTARGAASSTSCAPHGVAERSRRASTSRPGSTSAPRTPAEIALSILAPDRRRRRVGPREPRREPWSRRAEHGGRPDLRDDRRRGARARRRSSTTGETVYFCGEGCRAKFAGAIRRCRCG